jgi:hypothetical protein
MDEIEMMKAAFDSVSDALETSLDLNKAYLAKIAELEKDGKVCATCGGLVYDAVLPQTKPLSDEEIDDIWAGCSTGDDVIDMHQFARAIEAKLKGL